MADETKPRRLTKKPPPGAGSTSSASASDSHSLRSQKSSGTLSRTPSAPTGPNRPYTQGHNRTTTSPNPATFTYASSNSSLDHQISGPSPVLAGPDYAPAGFSGNRSSATRPLSEKTSQELIGAPFDGSGILSHIDSTKGTGYQNSQRRPPPPPLSHSAGPTLMSPPLRQSASFSAGDRMNEKMAPRVGENQLISPKRYSDESKEPKSGMIRKKSGFSSFMNTMGIGSPRGVKISAPENPVHVTHVGYDQDTGQFTVSCHVYACSFLLFVVFTNFIRAYRKNGSDCSTIAASRRRNKSNIRRLSSIS